MATARAAVEADSLQPLRDIETLSIAGAGGRAVRAGDLLTLAIDGGMRTFQDRKECHTETEDARCETYRLVAYLDRRGQILVAHFFYEGLKFVLIDVRSGREAELDGLPTFSPSGKFVLVLVNDPENGSAIQIWDLTDHGPSLAWQYASEDGYAVYRLTDWSEDSELSIDAQVWDSVSNDSSISLTIRNQGAQWVLAPG